MPLVSAGDIRVRVPGAPTHQSCATFWQGSNPSRARAYSDLLANAAPDQIYLLEALEAERATNSALREQILELQETLEDLCPNRGLDVLEGE